ncbi:laminin subunit alpha-like isoform X2 [Acanthaster planci]|uniref:Laminin subunit alpha-like isoform X2 n=1 Tax=Acanthaster planci TaxID=133434 RepID=A0A8B7Y866_ACAPL|nr:laminin subunit alpha-like isoform X2 [Acanthaster planci]
MASPVFVGLSLALVMVLSFQAVNTQLLTPTYFNVAEGKPITATATCGEGFSPPGELYCKLTGNTGDTLRQTERDIIQGQYCDYCDPFNPLKAHPIEYAIDGTEKWWQSPPLSRGTDFNGVNVTIDLGQLYHVAYLIIKFANSPRPGVWILERSKDYGQTYQAWQYFAETKGECNQLFGMESIEEITRDDDVICTDEYSSIVPLEDGEIVVSLVNGRPGATNFSFSEVLQEWTKATNIRLRLLRTNTLLGHLMAIARRDNTVTRRYFYSIKDISIGGRCVCNGHASTCNERGNSGRLVCACQHNTCGEECEMCCPGFVQKAWRPATMDSANECEPCNCFDHTNECVYNETIAAQRLSIDIYGNYEGGGVCQNCQHNTVGINCDQCAPGFYRQAGVSLDSPDVCQPCNCDQTYSTGNCAPITGECECRPQYTGTGCSQCNEGYYGYPTCQPCDCNFNGTQNKVCQVNGGQCPCKPNFAGRNCDRCALGFYNFPECTPCDCDLIGSLDTICDALSGQCSCRAVYGGRTCNECRNGFFNFPSCQDCICSPVGSTVEICDKINGQCICKDNFGGPRCDRCAFGNYNYPNCQACGCDSRGSTSQACYDSGQCQCLPNFTGLKCEECAPGYYRYPECLDCECHRRGSLSIMCDQGTGQCSCRSSFRGRMCEQCAEGFYNFPSCEECNCDPAGVIDIPGEPLGGCGSSTGGACRCKNNVQGRTCNTCEPTYWNLQMSNPEGCEPCECNVAGTINGMEECDMNSGQCLCKALVAGRSCAECRDGTFGLKAEDPLGCRDCACDVGGSSHGACDKTTGQCVCKARVTGIMCNEPLPTHFFPDLYQHKFEIEGGSTPEGRRLRVGFDETEFPGFSYLAYAVMSSIQPIVVRTVEVSTSSLYHLVLHYVYRGDSNVRGRLTITPSDPSLGSEQFSDILFVAGPDPQLVTIEGGGVITPFVLNPGTWTVTIEAPEGVLLDYLVLIPQAYYEATILQQRVSEPCIAGIQQERCNYYTYPTTDYFLVVRGVNGYYNIDGTDVPATQFLDQDILIDIGVSDLAVMDTQHKNLLVNIPIIEPGDYIFVYEYYGGGPGVQTGTVEVSSSGGTQRGYIKFFDCSFLCRAVVVDSDGMPMVFNVEYPNPYIRLVLDGNPDLIGISQVIAIPADRWSYDFVTPALQCVRTADGECHGSTYPVPTGSVWIDKSDIDVSAPLPPNIADTDVTLHYITSDGSGSSSVTYDNVEPLGGRYVYVVHYFQPSGATVDVNFNVVGEFDGEGSFQAEYCPHVSGCRAVVTLPDGSSTFDLSGTGQGYYISLPDGSRGKVWIDYVIAIPENSYNEDVLIEEPQDRAGEFIRNCAENNFYIRPDGSGFCRQATFSLSADYNNGALPCECNRQGSQSFNCEQLGGQCLCRPNISGRRCDRCKIGFYDFPNCFRCRCRSGVCNEVTGECICPDNVVGSSCDRCAERTFGYDPLVGCAECNCDDRGIVDGNFNCNQDSGQCNCKANIGGRQCDQCQPGFHRYPFCESCFCDVSGTEEGICNQATAECLCKENVEGVQCNQCKPGTFYLEASNPMGCISCFCFGHSSDCRSYGRSREKFIDMDDWTVTNMKSPLIRQAGNLINVLVGDVGTGTDPNQAIYWEAPESYLGNKLTSYGGKLEFTVSSNGIPERGDSTSSPLRRPDVIITGNNITIMYINVEQPQNGRSLDMSVTLLEDNFQYSFSARTVTREDMMMVLAGITSIQIRAQYYNKILDASLSDVSLDVTRKDAIGSPAYQVERCSCPSGYTGLSCEECEPGFRRSAGQYLGTCEPCDCNGHSNTCDPESGRCYDCQDNTEGDNCELCKVGYFGDATTGSPDSCTICSCPYPDETRNYAYTCSIVPEGMKCECLLGHVGERCDVCDEGYFGDPSQSYGFCRKCNCSGNSVPNANGPECDPRFGNCLQCRPGTTGVNCDKCDRWYYGDAVISRNCQECLCDRCGSSECDVNTGRCECKDNVVGTLCDRCSPGFWNFSSCAGCDPCQCALASESGQCDFETGQCQCKPGVGGAKCDQCLHGHWNYGFDGCQPCACEPHLRCDAATGECLCPPGATGDNCEFCEDRYIMTDEGCQPCDECVSLLLDMMNALDFDINGAVANLSGLSVGFETYQRLSNLNKSVIAAVNRTKNLAENNLVVSDGILIVETNYSGLLDQAIQLRIRSDNIKQMANETKMEALDTGYRAVNVERQINETIQAVLDAVKALYNNSNIPENANISDISGILAEARMIVAEIAARNFSAGRKSSDQELAAARDVLERVKQLRNVSLELMGHVRNVSDHMQGFLDQLQKLIDTSRMANNHSTAAENLNAGNQEPAFEAVILEVDAKFKGATEDVDNATALIMAAMQLLEEAQNALDATQANATALEEAIRRLEPRVNFVVNKSDSVDGIVEEAMQHAADLKNQSDYLSGLLVGTLELSENAIRAVNAYGEIVDAIDAAEKAAMDALNASSKAEEQANSFGNSPAEELKQSRRLNRKAATANEALADLDEKLGEVGQSVDQVRDRLDNADGRLAAIRRGMANIPDDGSMCTITVCQEGEVDCKPGFAGENCDTSKLSDKAQEAVDTAMEANAKATQATDTIADVQGQLPELRAKFDKIPTDVDAAIQTGNIADDASNRARVGVRDISNLDRELTAMHANIQNLTLGLQYNLDEIKRKIASARTLADGVKVAMKFKPDSSVQLRSLAPEALEGQAAYTSTSLFFRTQEPNALLFFMGGPTAQDDYYSLGIEDSNVVLRYNLGDGDYVVPVAKDVNDYRWHQVIGERTGKYAKVTVKGLGQDDVVQYGDSSRDLTILDLSPDSQIFVGGIPPGVQWLPAALPSRVFNSGGIDEVLVNGQPLSLWNFADAINADEGILRNDTIDIPVDPDTEGIMFNGSGYIVLPNRNFNPRFTDMSITFRTYAANGLLLFMGDQGKYFAVELSGGRVQFQFDLGTGSQTLVTNNRYNNGEQTRVHVNLVGNTGRLRVTPANGVQEETSGSSPGSGDRLAAGNIYVGGLVGIPDNLYPSVSRIGFRGCLRELSVGGLQIDPLQNIESSGVHPICVAERVSLVSFNGPYGGYVSRAPFDITTDLGIIFRFRTMQPDGVMVYTANADKSQFLAVMMVSGAVHVMGDCGDDTAEVVSLQNTYNDGEWHTVSVTKRVKKLTLVVDDEGFGNFNRFQKKTIRTDSFLLVGGFPRDDFIEPAILPTMDNFIGCIADLSFGVDKGVSFSDQIISDNNANLNACPVGSTLPTVPSLNTTGPDRGPAAPTTSPSPVTTPTEAVGTCKLPRVAGAGEQLPEDEGADQYGITTHSRKEYPILDSAFKRNMVMQVELKTVARNGLIMYTSDTRRIDFTAAYLRDGKVVFGWDYGSGPKLIESPDPVNDGRWHTVVMKREGALGELTIDGQLVKKDEIAGSNRFLRSTIPVYFGGVDPAVIDTIKDNQVHPLSRTSFVGCLRGFMLGQEAADAPIGPADRTVDVQPCTGIIEPGVFFGNEGGYLEQISAYSIGSNFEMRISIKPRVSTAVLMSVQGSRGDFLSLEMVDGVLYLRCENGGGIIEAIYAPPEGAFFLCDGNWHDILVEKAENELRLTVDGEPGERALGSTNAIAADTRDPLYFGGIPDNAEHQGLSIRDKFVGCIRDVMLRDDLVNFKEAVEVVGDVNTMSCPAN